MIAEHYEQGKSVAYHAKMIKEIAKRLDWHGDGKGRISALIDSAASQRTLASSKSVAELFTTREYLWIPASTKTFSAG